MTPELANYHKAKPGEPICEDCKWWHSDTGQCDVLDQKVAAGDTCDLFQPSAEESMPNSPSDVEDTMNAGYGGSSGGSNS